MIAKVYVIGTSTNCPSIIVKRTGAFASFPVTADYEETLEIVVKNLTTLGYKVVRIKDQK